MGDPGTLGDWNLHSFPFFEISMRALRTVRTVLSSSMVEDRLCVFEDRIAVKSPILECGGACSVVEWRPGHEGSVVVGAPHEF